MNDWSLVVQQKKKNPPRGGTGPRVAPWNSHQSFIKERKQIFSNLSQIFYLYSVLKICTLLVVLLFEK